MEYRAVNKPDPANELTHWKYIKREKKNGKWRYYYDDSELKKYENSTTETAEGYTTNGRGDTNKYKHETTYKKTNDLFDSKSKATVTGGKLAPGGKGYEYVHVTKSQGKLSRASAKAEKWVYDKFLSGEASRRKLIKNAQTKRKINNGKAKLKKLLGIN